MFSNPDINHHHGFCALDLLFKEIRKLPLPTYNDANRLARQ